MGRRHRPPPANSPSSPTPDEELDIQAFSDTLAKTLALSIRDVANDGNCVFRAVSDQLYCSEQYHSELRQRACDHLLRHKHRYADFLDDEQSVDEHVADMRNDGVWADHLELQAISIACRVNIRVHQSGTAPVDIRNHLATDAPVIHLSYHFGEHYASVRPLRTSALNAPAQHPPLPPLQSSSSLDVPRRSSVSSGTSAPRRPRKDLLQSGSSLWKRIQRSHDDLCLRAERTRRAAKAFRIDNTSPVHCDSSRSAARVIEREMRDARDKLDRIEQTIRDEQQTESHSSVPAVGLPPAPTPDDLRDRNVRLQLDAIQKALDETAETINQSMQYVHTLKKTTTTVTARNQKGGKKKEQDAKRKERKERRRREQERIARTTDMESLPPLSSHREPLDVAI